MAEHLGYMAIVPPQSQTANTELNSNENIKGTVKTAIAKLCSELFDSRSEDNALLKQFAKGSTRYETRLSFDPTQDRVKTKLNIHKYYEEIKNDLPQIVIADGGAMFKSPGIGFHSDVRKLLDGRIAHSVHIIREVPVVINIVTLAQQDTEKLANTLQMYWGDFVGLIHGYRIGGHDVGVTWHIHLPKIPEFGTVDKTNLGDSAIQQVWSSIITLQVTYESMGYLVRNDAIEYDVVENAPAMAINFPSTVRIGRWYEGTVTGLDPAYLVIVNDNVNAKIVTGEHWFMHRLLVKKPSTFKIQIIKKVIDQSLPGAMNGPTYTIMAEKTITATY